MTPNGSRAPEGRSEPTRSESDLSMSWGARQSESGTVSREEARTGHDTRPLRCPSCGSEKTTVSTAADRGAGSSIRRDNPAYRCFSCGTGWTVTIGGDHDPDEYDD